MGSYLSKSFMGFYSDMLHHLINRNKTKEDCILVGYKYLNSQENFSMKNSTYTLKRFT